MKRKLLATLGAAVLLSACATRYQSMSDTGGFEQTMISDNEYVVRFRGNGFTDKRRAADFALLRAAEIGQRLKFTHFAIRGAQDVSSRGSINTGSTSTTTGSVYGNTYTGTTTTNNNQIPVDYPGTELAVIYFEGPPTGRYLQVYEVRSVIQRITTQYKVRSVVVPSNK